MCRCSLWLKHSFDAARRKPEGARIDPIRIKLQYLVVELSRGRRRPGYAVEITNVLSGLFNDLGAVVVPGSLISGDHGARLKCLDRVEGGNPLAAGLRIGLGEVEVHAVVGGVTRNDQANGGNMQAGSVVSVGVPERNSS